MTKFDDMIIVKAIANRRYKSCEIERAIGMYFMCKAYGWLVASFIHSPYIIEKYSEILGISIKHTFPRVTDPSFYRNL